tara:strand:+ start:676 stop:1893 length:1218 start_codon:yes stop_codon:yes gene_type:complete
MATATTLTAWDNALKQYYRGAEVEKLVYDSHPFMELVPKDEKFRGVNAPIPVYYTRPQGRSATFATAQSAASASKIGEFLLTRKANYGVATISGEAVAASEGDRFSFLNAMTTEIDGVMRSVGDSISRNLFRDGSGAIGKVNNSSFGVTTLDLVTDMDSLNFEVGMVLQVAAAKTGGSVRSGTLTVAGVNRGASTMQITMSGNLSAGIAAIAQNDFVYQSGDYDGALTGLEGWLPASAPSSAAFFGQDRTDDITRLSGQRYDGSSGTILEALIEGAALAAREGGKPDHMFCSFADFVSIEKAMNAQVQRDVKASDSVSGYRSLEFYAPHGVVKIVPDKDCPGGTAYMLQMNNWSLMSIGSCVQLTELDGNRVLRQSADDGIEVRVHSYSQLACTAPGHNCVVTLP